MNYLFHLFSEPGFAPNLAPSSLQSEGFVHLSSADQVLRTANRWFTEASELKLLVLQTDKLGDTLKWEDTHGHGEDFPHLYSPIPEEAVAGVAVMRRTEGGSFEWPSLLNGLRTPLLEGLDTTPGLIEPSVRFPEKKLPSKCLLCFFQEALEGLAGLEGWELFEGLGSEIGATDVWVYKNELAVCHPGVGGPLGGATLEELIALGCEEFVVCGGAGSLVPEQTLGHLVLVSSALRDEGLSHHYLAPGQFLEVDSAYLERLEKRLEKMGVSFTVGASWTTDALYRETPEKVSRRRAEGCLTVEMELASLLAVAKYRGARLGALLYCGDDLSSQEWDFRDWTSAHSTRERMFGLGLELLLDRD